MKNKYQKLHRIVIGRSGSGKSFSILSNVKEDKKVNIINFYGKHITRMRQKIADNYARTQ